MVNGKKQQSLLDNPVYLFLIGVGVVLVAVLAVAMLQQGGLLKTGIPGESPLAKGACFYSTADIIIIGGYNKCKYVSERYCSTARKEIFVPGLACPGDFEVAKYNEYGVGSKSAGQVCIEKAREGIVGNEDMEGEICTGGELPVTLVKPVVVDSGSLGNNAFCVAIMQCVKPSPSPSKTPGPAPG